MFYPVEFLKRGGRFYLCWVADSWPLRFATITHRQLWSQDIRVICDGLLEVMTNESGRPTRRFSLRLSSQLMRGLVRLYQRKVTIFLSELCMLNANVTKHVNKKFVFHEEIPAAARTLPRLVPEVLENEERVEEMIQRSGNVVTHIDDITLKEPTLPEIQVLLNDNFGELHPDQLLLADKTLEVMMAQDQSAPQHSLELPLDFSSDKSHDKSRLAPHDRQMERISEHDLTLFNKSAGEDLLQIGDISKEIPGIPDLPELPAIPPALPDPQPEKEVSEKVMEVEQGLPKDPIEEIKEPEVLEELEELEEIQPPAKRRRVKGKIIDKNIKLSSNYLRARIGNCAVELRCEAAWEDVVSVRVPAHVLLSRAARAGPSASSALGRTLTRLFVRNLGPLRTRPLADREMEEVRSPRAGRSHTRSMLERIDEEVEPTLAHVTPQRWAKEPMSDQNVTVQDLADLPTQVIETLSQQTRKRTRDHEVGHCPKTPRRSGYKSFRQSQPVQPAPANAEFVPYEEDKENVPDNIPEELLGSVNCERGLVTLTDMLQAAGLADLPPRVVVEPASPRASQRPRKSGSESSETPLGSLDRTKVSLGDSDKTTDSMRMIRDNWGTEGTMVKIIKCVQRGVRPLDVRALIARGPRATGLHHIATARCFTSILKLKQHGFIKVQKDPVTLEILDISLGARFDAV